MALRSGKLFRLQFGRSAKLPLPLDDGIPKVKRSERAKISKCLWKKRRNRLLLTFSTLGIRRTLTAVLESEPPLFNVGHGVNIENHSSRIAASGSTRVARCAGSNMAKSEMNITPTSMLLNTTESVVLTS